MLRLLSEQSHTGDFLCLILLSTYAASWQRKTEMRKVLVSGKTPKVSVFLSPWQLLTGLFISDSFPLKSLKGVKGHRWWSASERLLWLHYADFLHFGILSPHPPSPCWAWSRVIKVWLRGKVSKNLVCRKVFGNSHGPFDTHRLPTQWWPKSKDFFFFLFLAQKSNKPQRINLEFVQISWISHQVCKKTNANQNLLWLTVSHTTSPKKKERTWATSLKLISQTILWFFSYSYFSYDVYRRTSFLSHNKEGGTGAGRAYQTHYNLILICFITSVRGGGGCYCLFVNYKILQYFWKELFRKLRRQRRIGFDLIRWRWLLVQSGGVKLAKIGCLQAGFLEQDSLGYSACIFSFHLWFCPYKLRPEWDQFLKTVSKPPDIPLFVCTDQLMKRITGLQV